MPIPFRAPALSSLLNQTFVNKTVDDTKVGKLAMYKINPSEATAFEDLQGYLAEISDTIGQDNEGDASRKDYSSTNFISNGEDRKQAIESLDTGLENVNQQVISLAQLIDNGSIKIAAYISDGAYETANGAPVGGSIYYNSTTGLIRYYNQVDSQWDDVGKQVLAVQEFPSGVIDGVNTNFDVTNIPTNDEALNVYVNGLIVPKTMWSFSSPTITLNFAPALGQSVYVQYLTDGNPATPVISAGTNNVTYRVITSGEESAKELTLSAAPATPSHVLIDIVGGSTVRFGSDFTISGTTLSWDGLNLDGLLTEGDIIRIQFFN